MKYFFAFILLLITTAGTFIPCCQSDGCCDEQMTTESNHKDKDEGACSPFFACTTCPGFVGLSKQVQLVHPLIQKQVHHEKIETYQLTSYLAFYWQPPRFC